MRFIDLFAGIGGFRKGLEAHGHKCVLSCEIDNNARKSYCAIHNEDNTFPNDVTTLLKDVKNFPKYDILCAGFPCQPFSRSGSREGFQNKTSGNLFFSVMDIINATNPDVIFLENVKGLLTSGVIEEPTGETKKGIIPKYVEVDKGLTFKIILEYLDSHGYNAQWQLINSAHFIAHKRERVYIVATKKENPYKQIFPFHTVKKELLYNQNLFSELLEDSNYDFVHKENAIFSFSSKGTLLDEKGKTFKFSNTTTPWKNFGMMIDGHILTAKVKHEPKKIYKLKDYLQKEPIDSKYILSKEEEEKQRYAKSPKTWKSGNKMGRMAFPDSIEKPSRTLTANSSGREMMVLAHGNKFRKLTAKEYYLLQGFSEKDYENVIKAGVSESQIKKQAGNAVTVTTINKIVTKFNH